MTLDFAVADMAQVDFGAGPMITDRVTGERFKTWIFVCTLAWSRHQYAEFVRNQSVETWLACHRHAFEWFNGVPQKIRIDNLKAAITKASYYEPTVQRSYAELALGYAFMIDPCSVADPKKDSSEFFMGKEFWRFATLDDSISMEPVGRSHVD